MVKTPERGVCEGPHNIGSAQWAIRLCIESCGNGSSRKCHAYLLGYLSTCPGSMVCIICWGRSESTPKTKSTGLGTDPCESVIPWFSCESTFKNECGVVQVAAARL